MHRVAVVQARMASERLPGKMMLPLDRTPVLVRVLERVDGAASVDETVLATPATRPDDVLDRVAGERGFPVHRGSESDVLGRMYDAAEDRGADVVVRICADCPLVDPPVVDAVVDPVATGRVDYASTRLDRSLPIGLDAEAFTATSFEVVERWMDAPHEREHVTVAYREDTESFSRRSVGGSDVFDDPALADRTDLRLTLDYPEDHELLEAVYRGLDDPQPSAADAIRYVDDRGIGDLNAGVEQRTMYDSQRDG